MSLHERAAPSCFPLFVLMSYGQDAQGTSSNNCLCPAARSSLSTFWVVLGYGTTWNHVLANAITRTPGPVLVFNEPSFAPRLATSSVMAECVLQETCVFRDRSSAVEHCRAACRRMKPVHFVWEYFGGMFFFIGSVLFAACDFGYAAQVDCLCLIFLQGYHTPDAPCMKYADQLGWCQRGLCGAAVLFQSSSVVFGYSIIPWDPPPQHCPRCPFV